ncbi:acyltransferase [Fibrisoma montanum]|uniref:Acyltransferase n=1 Tax=Fibrisoma montanum TaxID=2305895 RepID=A0A418M5N8_9BACT|nr:acyltransferase [Fibrisoma montanum]RIV21237.1 acyltransferase [Fibrisoma montanum]
MPKRNTFTVASDPAGSAQALPDLSRLTHMPQLDALRTLAVMLVVVYHWFPTGEGINRLPNGTIGVMIFFVISGFLISRILLQNRNRILAGSAQLGDTYRNFFVRRALRIFPLYYLVITFVLIALPQASDIDEHPLYYYLYGYNILLHQTGNWSDLLSPFWTLGVEEQLYLIWPWVVFLTSRSSTRLAIIGLIVIGVVSRGIGYLRGDLDGVLMPASLDAFGLGALWAYVITEEPEQANTFLKRLSLAAGLALVGFICLLLLPGDDVLVVLFQRLLISVLSLYLVANASLGIRGPAGRVLDNGALQYVGRISYGIYVFHMLVPGYFVPFALRVAGRFGIHPTLGYWSHRLFSLAVLIAVASASWYAFEKPINGLKRYFSYNDK